MAVAMAGWFVLIIFINTPVYADDLSSSLTASGIPTTTETSFHSNAFLDSVEKVFNYIFSLYFVLFVKKKIYMFCFIIKIKFLKKSEVITQIFYSVIF